jgi:hypothetical protein
MKIFYTKQFVDIFYNLSIIVFLFSIIIFYNNNNPTIYPFIQNSYNHTFIQHKGSSLQIIIL